MKIISNSTKLDEYIKKYRLEEIFGSDLNSYGKLANFSKGELILQSGDELENYYILVEGKAKIVYPFENGKEMPLKLYQGAESIGDIELLHEAPVLCDVLSLTDTCLIQIPLDIMKDIYLKSPEFLLYISKIISRKLYSTIKNVSYSYVYPLANRLATYLLLNLTEENLVELKDSYKNIAQYLGTSYRHLSRTLRDFEEKGLLSIDKKNITILDMNRLESMSKDQYIDSF